MCLLLPAYAIEHVMVSLCTDAFRDQDAIQGGVL